ncbi:insulin-like growth factor binding protein [Favolaschia claudopus]|uniref:Insulin-like growth factor binding protein n=1 Tax=Favolaschia claudopus TaxID=2862362 RepID=A0AAW0CK79_9AGAR
MTEDGICQCAPRKYSTGNSCLNCSPKCTSCSNNSPGGCLGCVDGATFVPGAIDSCPCPSNQYFPLYSDERRCTNCPTNCLTCYDNGPGVQCDTCVAGTKLTGGRCCATNQYSTGMACASCDPTCSSCSGPLDTNCLTCPDGFPANSGSCERVFRRKRNYAVPPSCSSCDASCEQCLGPAPTQCLSCKPSLVRTADGRCVAVCPVGTAPFSGTCVDCDPSCATCSGMSSDECTSCSSDRILCGGKCLVGPSCPSAQPVVPRGSRRSECPVGQTACPIPGRSFRSWECIDTRNDLESCGGCAFSSLNQAEATGQDCTALPGVADVSCLNSRCAVAKCMPGYEVHGNRTLCVETPRWLHLQF